MDKRKVEFINNYIKRCDAVENDVQAEYLQKEIVGVFFSDIPELTRGLERKKFESNEPVDYMRNIRILRNKLEYYKLNASGVAEKQLEDRDVPAVVVNQYNNNNQSLNASIQTTLEITQQQIDSLPDSLLSDDEKDLLRGKLMRIEEAPDKPTRWEKAKNALKWIAEKSIEVGTAALPYIVEALKK